MSRWRASREAVLRDRRRANEVNYNYTGSGGDIFAKLDISDLEVIAYYYSAKGLGTTALFNFGAYGLGQTRKSKAGWRR